MTTKDIDYNKDYYAVLGIKKTASKSDIKKAFRKLSLECHPDRHTDDNEEQKQKAQERFVAINEAYSILSDDSLRKAYDAGPQMFDPFGMQMNNDGPVNGRPKYIRFWISYEDICNGIHDRTIKYTKDVRCSSCHGQGGRNITECPHCHGTGTIVERSQKMGMFFMSSHTCQYCNGTGKHINDVCEECHGTGLVKKETEYVLDLSTENLLINGAQLFVGYLGNESTDERGRDGELIIEICHNLPGNISIKRINGTWTIIETRELPYYDMLLGGSQVVTVPSDKDIAVTVPPCSNDITQLRLKGQGMIINGSPGDYILVISTEDFSKQGNLTDEEIEMLKKIKEKRESLKN